jgi:hypothetical protein
LCILVLQTILKTQHISSIDLPLNALTPDLRKTYVDRLLTTSGLF